MSQVALADAEDARTVNSEDAPKIPVNAVALTCSPTASPVSLATTEPSDGTEDVSLALSSSSLSESPTRSQRLSLAQTPRSENDSCCLEHPKSTTMPSATSSDEVGDQLRFRGRAQGALAFDTKNASADKDDRCLVTDFVRSNTRAQLRPYTVEEVRRHNTPADCWVIIEEKVYNVTHWIPRHPAGEVIILSVAGMDITDAFLVNHLPWVRDKLLPLYQIGYVSREKDSTPPMSALSRDFRLLFRRFEMEGWFQTSYAYYIKMVAWYLFLFSASVFCVLCGSTFFTRVLLGSALMAIFWQQVAFIGHDLGHMAVFHHRTFDNLCGVIGGNMFMGIALGWWKATHNVHHLVTNYHEYDPDIQHLPVFAVSRKFFSGIYSFYHRRRFEFDWLSRQVVQRQHFLFYPVMFLARFNLYLQSILLLAQPSEARKRGVTYPRLELVMLAIFYLWFTQLLRCFPSWTELLIFLFMSHGLAGVLHLQICLSHFPMQVLDPKTNGLPLEKMEFMRQQLQTSLDVDCWPWLDWFHGGLQFQTTHHLFPLLPRHRLREAMHLVQALCDKYQLTYNKLSFFQANRLILTTLKTVADGIHPWLYSLAMCDG